MGHIDVAFDAALLELHVVLREGAGLVREDVLHLRAGHSKSGRSEGGPRVSEPDTQRLFPPQLPLRLE